MDNVLFSVICPIYNAQKTLRFSIGSIKNQTYKNWELILIDDGSTDSSGDICDEFAKEDKRIKVIHKKNEGQAKTRLDGVYLANGQYLLFLDSDDQYEPNALQEIKDKLKETSISFLVYNAKSISGEKETPIYKFYDEKLDSPMVECFCKRKVSYFWTICFKKELLLEPDENIKATFSKITYSEDCYLIYNIIKNLSNDNFGVLNKELYRYINNPSSITNNQNASKLLDRFFVFNYVFEDMYRNYPKSYKVVFKQEKDATGWTLLSAARKIALEFELGCYFNEIKRIRKSFLFKHLMKFKKDKYNLVAYILLKLKMYRRFRKYIIKHESK